MKITDTEQKYYVSYLSSTAFIFPKLVKQPYTTIKLLSKAQKFIPVWALD